MARKAYARRYAQAVFRIAQQRGELERWQSDMVKIARLGEDADFVALLENPKVRLNDKIKLLSGQFIEVNPLALNLVYLLIARGRLGMVADIADEYQRFLDSYHGIERAEVITAVPLDDKDKLHLAERLAAIVGKQVIIKPEVDAKLLGGVVARVGGKLLDGSTRTRLETLKRQISGMAR
ncbi:MAG: F-type H+-transporting ATPase subunit delta [Dehalococcoidales bacterium]|nr:F-type H+-transporting ATPase subunit delta [Dehalococcoidales bacterium]